MKHLLTLILIVTGILVSAQNILPAGFAKGEKELMPLYLENLEANGITTPPTTIPRSPAEWEEMQAVVISWKSYNSILAEIVRHAREECKVVIMCSDVNSVKNYLDLVKVDYSSNVDFVVAQANSVWIRDYGANPIYLNRVDSLAFVDWIYNRPRPLDNKMPDVEGTYFNLPVYATTSQPFDLVHTGGNFMSDGMGTGFSSNLVLDENGPNNIYGFSNHSEQEVDSIMYKYMGIDKYIKMTNLPFDAIHHIDMHMKLLDEQTLIVGKYPDNIADGPQIEANLQYVLNNFKTRIGTPFRVIRVPMPADKNYLYPDQGGDYRTFANALIINKSVLLPIYEMKYDTTAIKIWESAMPGYKIRGINCDGMISASGAIHCITKEVGVAQPLLLQHFSLDDVQGAYPAGYPIAAHAEHKTGINNVYLNYRIKDKDTTWTRIPMTAFNAELTDYESAIPEQANGTVIEYYIEATANNGKIQYKPMTAPLGFYTFKVNNTSGSKDLTRQNLLGEIFPNPAKSITCIPVSCAEAQQLDISIIDVFGKPVKQIFNGKQIQGESKYFFDASQLVSGNYFVKIIGEHGSEVKLVLVQ